MVHCEMAVFAMRLIASAWASVVVPLQVGTRHRCADGCAVVVGLPRLLPLVSGVAVKVLERHRAVLSGVSAWNEASSNKSHAAGDQR